MMRTYNVQVASDRCNHERVTAPLCATGLLSQTGRLNTSQENAAEAPLLPCAFTCPRISGRSVTHSYCKAAAIIDNIRKSFELRKRALVARVINHKIGASATGKRTAFLHERAAGKCEDNQESVITSSITGTTPARGIYLLAASIVHHH